MGSAARVVRAALAAAGVGLVVVAGSPMAFASSAGSVLPTGTAVDLPSAGIGLTAPADGRVNGYWFTGRVTGVGFSTTAGPAADRMSAPAGGRLCVFRLTITVPLDLDQALVGTTPTEDTPPAVTVSAGGGQAIPVPLESSASIDAQAGWDTTAAVSVAKGSDPVLSVSFGGFTQWFDLATRTRLAPDPAGLYRSTSIFPYLVDRPSVTGTLVQTGGGQNGSVDLPVTLTEAFLTYFPPAGVHTLPPADDTYLAVEPSLVPPDSDGQYEPNSMPATMLTLRLPTGQVVAAKVAPDPSFGQDQDWFAHAVYYFTVPATYTTGTLTIHATGPLPGMTTGENGTSGASGASGTTGASGTSGTATTATLSGTVVIPITFSATRFASGSVIGGGGGSSFPTAPALGAGIPVVAGAGLLVLRRLLAHPLPARPVTRPLSYTLAAAHTPITARGGTDVILGVIPLSRDRPAPRPAVLSDEPVDADPSPLLDRLPPPPTTPPPILTQDQPALVVGILGPLDVQGLTCVLRRRPAQRLLIYLAVSTGRPLSSDQLRHALATSDDHEPSAESLRRYASDLRQALPEGILPAAGDTGGYQLTGSIQVDWVIFQTLTAQAARLPEGSDRLTPLRQALALVRGIPLTGDSWEGIHPLIHHVEASVERSAADAATLAVSLSQPQIAEEAVTAGLRATPYSPLLWGLRLQAAAAGSGLGLERAWQHTQERLGADAAVLAPTYQQLRAQPS